MHTKPLIAVQAVLAVVSAASAQPLFEDDKLTANDGAASDRLGTAVAIDGPTIALGADGDDTASASEVGSVYLFNANTGQQVRKITHPTATAFAYFGYSVDVDGGSVAVGAPRITGSGNTDPGEAFLFDAATGSQLFEFFPSDPNPDDGFGHDVAISDGVAVVGAPRNSSDGFNAGAAYLFDTTTGLQTARLASDDIDQFHEFGWSVDISDNTVIVGAPGADGSLNGISGAAYLFDATTGQQIAKLNPPVSPPDDRFGYAVAIDGNIAVVGTKVSQSGWAAYVFDIAAQQRIAILTPSDGEPSDFFAESVAVYGNTVVVGAWGDDDGGGQAGAAYIFDATTGDELAKLLASDNLPGDAFGFSVAITNDRAVAGAPFRNEQGAGNVGAAYVYDYYAAIVCPGDATGDGLVNADDLLVVLAAFGTSVSGGAGAGDFNGDGQVNADDLLVVLGDFGGTCP